MTDQLVLIYLGILDDGDIAPTVVIGLYEVDAFTPEEANTLREVAEEQYGRRAPDHALFWFAKPPDD